jgi:uncharacterized protein YciI
MAFCAITRQAGPGWTDGLGAFDQPGVGEHAAYMDGLGEDGFALLAGPLAGSEAGRLTVLLIATAADEDEVHDRLAGDPWVQSQHLVTTSIEVWQPLLGAERLTSVVEATATA